MGKKFRSKKIGEIKQYNNFLDVMKSYLKIGNIIKASIIIFFFSFIVYFSGYAINFTKQAIKNTLVQTVKFASTTLGQEPKKDELGQINFLILGYGGASHDGGYLADTIMIASYDPGLGAVSFLSVPRDLYVETKSGYRGRINGLFGINYYRTKDLEQSIGLLQNKLKEMTGVDINYYAIIDFAGFVSLIDKLGGIDIYVPQDFIDYKYPDNNLGYETFKLDKGWQNLDGATALKYARSRHSTSDFSRALRQQQIIKAVIKKVLTFDNLTNIDKLKGLYNEYNKMIKTNLEFKNMLGMVKYMDNLKYFFSYVLSTDCNQNSYKLTEPGCLLYNANRDNFNGMAVLLPIGAGSSDVSNYKYIQKFAFGIIYNQEFLIENAKIKILNGTNKDKYGSSSPLASKLGIKLKQYGFNVIDVDNAKKSSPKTTLIKNGTGDYENTINLLKMYVDIDSIQTGDNYTDADLTLILGNSYVTKN